MLDEPQTKKKIVGFKLLLHLVLENVKLNLDSRLVLKWREVEVGQTVLVVNFLNSLETLTLRS